jgi:hypothetical protein
MDETTHGPPASDPFIGVWRLVPEASNYEYGDPPSRGRYDVAAEGAGYKITMNWTTSAGQVHQMSYNATPDGVAYPYEDPTVAETVSMTRVDWRTLDSESRKGGNVIAHARRVLSADENEMGVTQSGKTADGRDFSNFALYRRE